MRRYLISVIGDRKFEENSQKWELAVRLGKRLVTDGYRIVTGGIGSLPKALALGARGSANYREGDLIAILPSFDPILVDCADIVIATGLDQYRNLVVANGDAVIAIGGGAGTLSELAFAWSMKRLVLCYNVLGWSGKLSGKRIDGRVRYPNIPDDRAYLVEDEKQVSLFLKELIPLYSERHHGIPTN